MSAPVPAAPPGVGALRGELRRALLRRIDGKGELEVHFNPDRITIRKTSRWTTTPVPAAASAPNPSFGGAEARTMSLTLTLDAPSSGRDVAADAELLQSWCNPTSESRAAGTPQPPLLELDWTSPALFQAYLTSVEVGYVLFDRDGAPLRATAAVAMTESPASAQAQNPTSGGPAGHRDHVLESGDSLQSLAYRVYGDAALWRGLARFNRVDDPMALRPGVRVELPPIAVIRARAR
jgi:hypothetical protein